LPAGATVGRYAAALRFLSPSSGNVTGGFCDPERADHRRRAGQCPSDLTSISARSLGTLRGSGTLRVIDDDMGGPTQYVFQLN
jgi:hypothetical protein